MLIPGGIVVEGPNEDEAYDRYRQRQIDAAVEAARRVCGNCGHHHSATVCPICKELA